MTMLGPERLIELARPPADKAIDALEAGDLPRLHQLLAEMASAHAGVESMSLHVLARFSGELRRDLGDLAARGVLDEVATQLMNSFVRDWLAGQEESVITDLISIFKHQGGGNLVPVTETAEEVVYDLTPCGSGGRFVLDGSIQREPMWYGPWDDGVPSACQACKACQRALNQVTGEQTWTTEISETVPGRCTLRLRKQQTRGQLLFPGLGLYAVARTRMQEIQRRISRHDMRLSELLRDHHVDWMPWHDFVISLMAYLFGACQRIGGTEYLNARLDSAYNSTFRLFYPVFTRMSDEAHLSYLCTTHHYHMMQFKLDEEEDRFVFRLDPCGSGGRLLRGQMWRDLFHYGAQPDARRLTDVHPITFGRNDLPVYCTHCAAHNRDQFLHNVLYFVNDGHAQREAGSACLQYTYKKGVHVESVDPRLKAQVGIA
jgi:hypothetical protein